MFDASVISEDTNNRIGSGGFAIDTERDNTYSPNLCIQVTGGTGTLTIGPYNIQPAWGCGFEFKLEAGQNISLLGDRKKVVGDGSTDRLYLDVDRVAPNI